MLDEQHQTCKICRRPQRFEFSVPDELWRESTGDVQGALCIECWLELFDRRLRESGLPERKLTITDFRYVCIVGAHVWGTLHDAAAVTSPGG